MINASASYRYRNPLSSFFANASLSYNYYRNAIMTNQVFIDDMVVTTFADCLSANHGWTLNGGISKGLGHSRMVVGCDVSATTYKALAMRDYALKEYDQKSITVTPYFKGSLTKWLAVNYDAKYGFTELRVNASDNITHSFNQKLDASIIPSDSWQFTLGAEHFLTKFPEGNITNLVLLDASASWYLKRNIRLFLTGNNLLNRRSYEYINYGTLSRTEHSFRIRPRNVIVTLQYRF